LTFVNNVSINVYIFLIKMQNFTDRGENYG